MTLKMLSKYYVLRKKLMLYEDTLGNLRAAAEAITPKLSDMPKSQNRTDKISMYVAQIVDLEKQIVELKSNINRERQVVINYIATIQDRYIKTIFSLRFIGCMTWAEIAEAMGGDNTEDSVKKVCYRYLNTHG